MPVGDILRVVPVTMLGSQLGLNVRHFRVANTVAPEPDRDTAAAVLEPLIAPLYKAVIASGASWMGLLLQREFPLPRSVQSQSSAAGGPGLLAGDQLPPQVASLVNLRTAMAGRKFRGRMYIPFPTEAVNDSGHEPTTGYLVNVQAIGSFFATNHTISSGGGSFDMIPVIYHRATHTFDDVTTFFVRTHWGTQRRRGDFGRPNSSPIA